MSIKLDPGRISLGAKWLKMPLIDGVGFDSLKNPIPLKMHQHEGFELTYLSSGEVSWELETGRCLHLSGGQAAITQPKVRHQGQRNIIKPCRLFWIAFNPAANNARKYTPLTEKGNARTQHKT